MLNAGLLVALVKIRDENNISRLFLTMILLCSFSATMQFVLQHYDEGLKARANLPVPDRTRAQPITFMMCSIPNPFKRHS